MSIKCGSGFESGRRSDLHLGIRESDVDRMEAFFVARMWRHFLLSECGGIFCCQDVAFFVARMWWHFSFPCFLLRLLVAYL